MPEERPYIIVGIGEILWDIYREARYLGGAPSNVAVLSQHLGDKGVVVSRIGNDGLGRELLRTLEAKELSRDYLQIDKRKGTGSVFISLDVRGEASFHCSYDVAFDYLQFTPDLAELAEKTDAVVFSALAQRTETARTTIAKFVQSTRGIKIFDVNARSNSGNSLKIIRQSLELANIVRANENELNLIKTALDQQGENTYAFAQKMLALYDLKMIVVSKGALGATLITPDQVLSVPAIPVNIVDSTGAGDAFTAGFVHRLLRGASTDEALRFANALAAYVCTRKGATPRVTPAKLEKFMQEHVTAT